MSDNKNKSTLFENILYASIALFIASIFVLIFFNGTTIPFLKTLRDTAKIVAIVLAGVYLLPFVIATLLPESFVSFSELLLTKKQCHSERSEESPSE